MYAHLPMLASSDVETQITNLEQDSYVYIPDVLSRVEVESLKQRIDQIKPNADSNDSLGDPGDPTKSGDGSIHIKNAFNHHTELLSCIDKLGVIEIAEGAMGKDCHLVGMSAWKSGPGRPDQNLHVDYRPIDLPEDLASDPRVRLPIFIATAHFYLNDITEELGPTRMIPGSHRAGRRPRTNETDWNGINQQSVMVNAGDVVMFRSEIWHRGSANTGTDTRYLIQVHYANRWISSRMPPYLNKFQFDPSLLANATPRQLRLLGDHVIGGPYT